MRYAWVLLGLLALAALSVPAWGQDSGSAEEDEIEIELDDIELDDIEIDGDEIAGGFALGDYGDDETEEIDLGEAEVSGEAIEVTVAPAPAVTDVITRDEIINSGAANVDELLTRSAGFTVNDTFAGSEVSFQGLPSKFTTVLIDGQRVPGHIMERVDFGQLPLSNVERVEIIRGPQAAAYGSDSAGVVINLITLIPTGTGGSVTLGIGSFGYNREHIDLHGGDEDNSWMIAIERKLREKYDLEDTFPDTSGDSFKQYDIFAKYRRKINRDTFSVSVDWFKEEGRGQSFSPPDQIRSNETLTRRFSAGLAYDWQLDGNRSLRFDANYGSYFHDFYRYWVGFEEDTAIRTNFRDEILDLHTSYLQYGADYIFSAGIERNFDSFDSDRVQGEDTKTAEITAGFTSMEWYVNDDWTLTGSLRVDHHDNFGTQVSPKASITRHLDEHSELSLGGGTGYRSPSLREQYYEFASPFGYSVIGNAELDPETSTSVNLDYRFNDDRRKFSLGAFHHEVENLIVFTEIQDSPQIFQTENVSRAISSGFQLSAEQTWPVGEKCEPIEIYPHLAVFDHNVMQYTPPRGYLGTGYELTWIANSEDKELGTELPNSPQWDHRFRVFYEEDELRSEVVLRHTARRYLDRGNFSQAPAYTTVDLTLARELSTGTVRLAALNVFDEKHGRYGPEPGRELRLEYTFDFN